MVFSWCSKARLFALLKLERLSNSEQEKQKNTPYNSNREALWALVLWTHQEALGMNQVRRQEKLQGQTPTFKKKI